MGGSAKKMFGGGALGATLGALTGLALAPFTGGASLGLTVGAGALLGGAQGVSTGKQAYDAEKLAKQEAAEAEKLQQMQYNELGKTPGQQELMESSSLANKDNRNALRRTMIAKRNKVNREAFGGNSETLG